MNQEFQMTQQAWSLIRELASLASSEGTNGNVKNKANENIEALLDKIITPSIKKLTLSNSGITL